MPFETKRESQGAYKRFFGFVSGAEFLQSVFENHSDPDYDSMAYTINDFLGVTGYSVDATHVRTVAAYGRGAEFINAKIKVAIVTEDAQVREMVKNGQTEQQITEYMTARYGDFVLYRPPFNAATALLWVGPAVMVVGGLLTLFIVLRRRSKMSADKFDADEAEVPQDPHLS